MAAAALFLYLKGRHLTFYADEWDFLMHRRGHGPDTFLRPVNGHLLVLPIAVYKALAATVGAGHYWPYRAVSLAALLLDAGLLFLLVRRRVGDGAALLAAVVVLFLGTGWEQSLSAIGLIVFISLGAGLGMLLALESGRRRSDALACGLLAVSLASFSYGLAFALAAAVEIALGPRRRQRAWVVAAPLALYGVWLLAYGEHQFSTSYIRAAPTFVADSLGAVLASLSGLYRSPGQVGGPSFDLTWGPPLAVLFAVAVAWRLRAPVVRARPRVWAALALALGFWASIAVVAAPGREPQSSRYQTVGAVFVLLLVAELLPGARLGRRGLAAGCVVVAILLAVNVPNLADGARVLTAKAQVGRAELTAIELARDSVAPDFHPEPGPVALLRGHFYAAVDARSYLRAAHDFGSPAYTAQQLERAPRDARTAADLVLAGALRLAPRPVPTARGRCSGLPTVPAGPAALTVAVPRGGLVVRSSQPGPIGIALRRFGPDFAVALPPLGRGPQALAIPRDRSSLAWHARLDGLSGPVAVCAL